MIQEFNHNLLDDKNNVHGIAATQNSAFRNPFYGYLLNYSGQEDCGGDIPTSTDSYDLSWPFRNGFILRDDELWGRNVSTVRSMGTEKDMILDFGTSRTVKTKGDGMELRQ